MKEDGALLQLKNFWGALIHCIIHGKLQKCSEKQSRMTGAIAGAGYEEQETD